MRKNILITLFVLLSLNLFSQIEKGDFIISFEGNFLKSQTGSGVTTNQFSIQGKYLMLGTSVGYVIKDNFVLGLGFDYHFENEIRTNHLDLHDAFQVESLELKSNAFLPNLYLGFYYPIINKLYFNANLKFHYGIGQLKYKVQILGYDVNNDTSTIPTSTAPYASVYESKYDFDFFSTRICPELSYFISRKFSLYLSLGKIEYSLIDWEVDNSNWVINFNPNHWIFGMKLRI